MRRKVGGRESGREGKWEGGKVGMEGKEGSKSNYFAFPVDPLSLKSLMLRLLIKLYLF